MPVPRHPVRLLLALLLIALPAALWVTTVPAGARAGFAAGRPHGKPAPARTVVKGFTQRRAHGRRGLPPRKRSRVPARRPVPPAPVNGLSAPPSGGAPLLLAPGQVTGPPPAVPSPDLPSPVVPDPALPDPAPDPAPATSSTLGVQTLDTPEYRVLLSRPSVTAGSVRLQLRNSGEDPHILRLTRTDGTGDAIFIPLTAPGTSRTMTVRLTTGDYRLVCTLTAPVDHESAGMRATLNVAPAP